MFKKWERIERKKQKDAMQQDRLETYGKQLFSSILISKKVRIYDSGYVSVSPLLCPENTPEKLVSFKLYTDARRKSALGRSIGLIATTGLSAIAPNMRGELHVTIVTDDNVYQMNTSTPSSAHVSTMNLFEAIANKVLSQKS